MNLGFGAEHEALRDEFRKVLATAPPRRFLERQAESGRGFDEELWTRCAKLGWLATAIPEEHGGSGLDKIALCVLAEEIGRSMAAVPFTASICGYAIGLGMSGNVEALSRSLPRIADGSAIGVLLTPDCWDQMLQLQLNGAGEWLLSGTATNVLDGACATEAMACIGHGAESRLVSIDLAQRTRKRIAAKPLDLLHATATLEFDQAAVRVLATGPAARQTWEDILNEYALFVAFEQLGGAEAALEMARQHSLNRYAFGRPIGSFQAIKHMLADMLVSVELARSNCHFGAAALSMGEEVMAEAAAVARISATEAFRCCARGNIQVHGALGVTWESDCHLYYRRAQTLAGSPGTPRFWKERLIELLVRRRVRGAEPTHLELAGGRMNVADLPEEVAFRARARAWIRENAPWDRLDRVKRLRFAGQAFEHEHDWLALARQWQKKKYDAGWACLVWPTEYGGHGLTPAENVIFQEEEGSFAELSSAFMIGQGFIAPTLMAHASEQQKRDLLPGLASGESIWCQMFSEPGAGSDLAGVRTRAEACAGGWRLNGQKVWTSGAHHSDWGMALVRTDPGVPKHKGLTMFFLDMSSPGITVRPIKQLSGSMHFNEVFFDDVFVPDEQRLGAINDGWKVALTTLTNERMTLGASVPLGFEEIFDFALRRGRDGSAPIDSEDVRLRLAEWYAKTTGTRFGVYRMLTTLSRGGSPGAESAVGKLVGAITTQDIAAFGLDLMEGQGRALADGDEDAWLFHSMFAFGALHRLEGGTDEVLRNIIAERVLGLPPDIRMDGGAFRDVPTAPPSKG